MAGVSGVGDEQVTANGRCHLRRRGDEKPLSHDESIIEFEAATKWLINTIQTPGAAFPWCAATPPPTAAAAGAHHLFLSRRRRYHLPPTRRRRCLSHLHVRLPRPAPLLQVS